MSINVTTKTVYVKHDWKVISAQQLTDALNEDAFEAELRADAATIKQQTDGVDIWVESTFAVSGKKNGEISDDDLGKLSSYLQKIPKEVFKSYSTCSNSPSTYKVIHNAFCLPVAQLKRRLEQEFPIVTVDVQIDGTELRAWDLDQVQQSGDTVEESTNTTSRYPKPSVILSGIFWIVSMLHLIGGNWEYLKYTGLLSVAFGLPTIAFKAFRTLRRGQFDTNCLMLLASIGGVALQEFAEAAAVVFLFSFSEWLEVRATSRAREALSAIVNLRPDVANLVHPVSRELLEVPAGSVPVGALLSVKTGEKVPCDGVVVEGQSTVDESSLTGESRPVSKGVDSKVSGGTLNAGASQLMVRTTATCEDSAVSRLIRLVEEAQTNRSETEKLVDIFSRYYTPVVVLAAVLMCSIPWAFGHKTGMPWTNNGLVLIVLACPCALVISTPVTYVAGLAASARRGVLIKGGSTLEALSMVRSICFDKTGTLTTGEFAVLQLKSLVESLSRQEVLQYLALMEERASHPVALAILNAVRVEKVTVPSDMTLEKHKILPGEGVAGIINGIEVNVGNERLFERLGMFNELHQETHSYIKQWKSLGGTVDFMSIEGHGIVCAFCAADRIRAESAAVADRLQKRGINLTMLTGDIEGSAEAVGSQVGLKPSQVKSKLLPADKLRYIQELSASGTAKSLFSNLTGQKTVTLMCGDGVNDAPALAAAHIGVAMGAGAALAMETADVTLLDSNLAKLEYCLDLGHRVTRKIKQNVIFSIGVKLLVLAFALMGQAHLWAAIASDVGAMILVTLNSMMILSGGDDSKLWHGEDSSSGKDIEEDSLATDIQVEEEEEEEYKQKQCHGCCSNIDKSVGTCGSSKK